MHLDGALRAKRKALFSQDLLERAGFMKTRIAQGMPRYIKADEEASDMQGETFLAQNWADQAGALGQAVLRRVEEMRNDTESLATPEASSVILEEFGITRKKEAQGE